MNKLSELYMQLHQKILTGILLLLTGVLIGILIMITRGSWIPPERVEVRYTDVARSTQPIEPAPGEEHYSPSFIFRDIAKEIIPAVVYIETDIAVDQHMPNDENHQFENQFWERFLPRRRAQSIGSGVLITPDGYILTNHHVIDGAGDRIQVMTHDKKQYQANLVGSDPSTDLAVIKIDTDDRNALVIGNSDHVDIGDWVMAVGNPFRLQSTVTAGIISALGRDVDIINDRMRIESFIQTDAAINRGNSGGALVNTRGELIGINTAIASESGSYQGYGFAVPVNLAMKIGQDMIEHGEVRRAYLGVEIATVDHQRAQNFGLESVKGVEIRNVVPQGSADQGGLVTGDVVLKVNGFQVSEANRLQERIALMRPGEEVEMKIWRDSAEMTLEFPIFGMDNEAIQQWTAAEVPSREELEFEPDTESGVRQESYEPGFTVAELPNPGNMSQNELVVIRVIPESRADVTGIFEEDVITDINGQDVSTIEAFNTIWSEATETEADDPVTIGLRRNGESLIVELDLPG